jgi:hypothetical protein
MEILNNRECLGLITISADNTTPLSENTYDTAMFTVSSTMFVRQLQNTQKIVYTICGDLEFNTCFILCSDFGLRFQVRDKARPWAGFQLVQ